MKSHRHTVLRRRCLAIGLAAITALAFPGAAAIADPGSGHSATTGADWHAKVGDTPADFPGVNSSPDVPTLAKVGDTPADFPGVSGPSPVTPVVEVVRPERTIVREADQALPIALSSAALVIVLMGAAFVLVRARVQRRHVVGGSH
jgi:hypothetical protein